MIRSSSPAPIFWLNGSREVLQKVCLIRLLKPKKLQYSYAVRGPLKWSLCVVVAAALCVTIILLRQDNGPRYGGHNLSRWLNILNEARPQSQDAAEATTAIREIGTNALPYALRWIQEKRTDSIWSDPEEETLSRCDIAPDIFGVLGPVAKPAIPELVKIACTDSLASYRAVNSLAAIGPDALPSILGIINNTNATDACRRQAMTRLGNIGTNEATVLPTLVHSMQDTNLETALVAFEALIQLDIKSPMVLSVLTNELENPEIVMRMRAINALIRYGPGAREVLPALARRLQDSDPHVRRFATNALHRIAPDIYTNALPKRVRVSPASQ